MDNTWKFSGVAKDYAAGRPAYAQEFVESLYLRHGFSKRSVIADIGSGTGKFARQLLDKGSFVYCVEPNDDMCNVAVRELSGYGTFRAVNGTAEETTLEEGSVDFITAAQAFHWFDVSLFQKECRRILRGNGMVFLIWNMRDMSDEANQRSFAIYSQYCSKFVGFGGGIQKDDTKIKQFFSGKYEYAEFDNPLFYDRDKFIRRSLSGSYSLKSGEKGYDQYLDRLSELFERYAKDGILEMANKTVVYAGKV